MFFRFIVSFVLIVTGACVVARPVVHWVDRRFNSTYPAPLLPASERARTLHSKLWIADMHCDALAWDRDLLARSNRGHVDLPRLQEGHVSLQVFSAATRDPVTANYRRTLDVGDAMDVLAIAQRWPRRTWFDSFARAQYQALKLHRAAVASSAALVVVTSRADIDTLAARQVGGLLSLEGLHVLGGDIARVDSLFAAGYRVFGIAHMADNAVGGSAHGWRKHGLTPFGRRVLARIDSLGGIIDLAHASPRTIDDVLAATTRPVLVSHTGVQNDCPGPRNLSDDHVVRIAARGGLIAIGFWNAAMCGTNAGAIAHAIRHCANVAGIEHVAIGSDFDGGVRTPFDASSLVLLTDALIAEGFSNGDIERVMGLNARRFLRDNLPAH